MSTKTTDALLARMHAQHGSASMRSLAAIEVRSSADGGQDRAPDATIHEVMMTNAFDDLGVELERAFFGAQEASQ